MWQLDLTIGLRRSRLVICDATSKQKANAAKRFAGNVDRLIACQLAGDPIPSDLATWIDALPVRHTKALAKLGLVGRHGGSHTGHLAQHIDDFEKSILSRGRTDDHAKRTRYRVDATIKKAGVVFVSELNTEIISAALDDLDLSPASRNHYTTALRSFGKWLSRTGRSSHNRLDGLSGVSRRTAERRSLDEEEISALLRYCQATDDMRYNLDGTHRYWIYRMALETALRRGHLSAVRVRDLDLTLKAPLIRKVESANNKAAVSVPLLKETARELKVYVSKMHPDALPFPVSSASASMLREDLEAAGVGTRDVTFHTLRHTAATRAGRTMTLKELQAFGGWSTAQMAMRYAHSEDERVRKGLRKLPC